MVLPLFKEIVWLSGWRLTQILDDLQQPWDPSLQNLALVDLVSWACSAPLGKADVGHNFLLIIADTYKHLARISSIEWREWWVTSGEKFHLGVLTRLWDPACVSNWHSCTIQIHNIEFLSWYVAPFTKISDKWSDKVDESCTELSWESNLGFQN